MACHEFFQPPPPSLIKNYVHYVSPCSVRHVQVRRDVKRDHYLHAQCKFHFIGYPPCFCRLFLLPFLAFVANANDSSKFS